MAKDEINAFLGTGTFYEGKLAFEGTVRVDGEFRGEIESEGTLVVGKEALVKGNIKVGQIIVSGRVDGDVLAKSKMVMYKEAKFFGTLTTPSLMVEEGAIIQGQVNMAKEDKEEVQG
ncbi:polymer-forming cytoskeletal protein [Desulfohalobiaceae bacterium Ax17]|jgi:cytoskeletal protein CcmA (bactofilin family)|uniref:bactofilin family protein n=1 Tax=Desulfovulcanus ferrireducens TaxID=2831190 RepID=UPI00207BC71F|nr:polymer-forming cytoskeletal protein [Desulfovulcanus ferrireducens]MBT8763290.1 polymer-forming cytoskeletal protein [Desulfovulcanus ferrireducens]